MPSVSKEKQKQYDEKRKLDRPYNWNLVCYPDDLPSDWLDSLKSVTPGFCSPLHNLDINPDGASKKAHYHVTLCFPNKMPRSRLVDTLKDLFGDQGDSIKGIPSPQPCTSVTGSVRYMAHADNPEKAQYERTDIIAWGGKSVDKVWGDDDSLIRDNLVSLEELIEERGIVELSDLSRVLRLEERWDLYDTLTRRCTTYITHFLSSRRHRAERIEDGKNERANECIDMCDLVAIDQATGEVISESKTVLPTEGVTESKTVLQTEGVEQRVNTDAAGSVCQGTYADPMGIGQPLTNEIEKQG